MKKKLKFQKLNLNKKMDQNQLANLSPAQKEEIMQTVQAQVALANMQVKFCM